MKNDRQSFAEQLNSTIIPSNTSPDEQQIKLEALSKTAHNILPKSLFRFRSCSERSISAFDNDQLWVSTADCMNDGFDTRIYIDQREVHDQISKWTLNHIGKEEILQKIANIPYLPQEFAQAIESFKMLSEDEIKELADWVINWVLEDTAKALLQMPSVGQQTLKFCCFSENISSPYMWGIYASNESGFALEYDFTQTFNIMSPNQFSREATLFPIIYNDKRYQVSTEYVLYLLEYRLFLTAFINSGIYQKYPEYVNWFLSTGICPDLLMATKISLYKSTEWEKEAEWRLFCTSVNDVTFQREQHSYCIKKPTAIYLGRRISQINEKILRKLAEDKALPVYRMKLDDNSVSYHLIVEA